MSSAPHEPSGRTVLVTGAAGFIGSHLSEALASRGDRVVGVDNFDPFYDASLKRANVEAVRATAGDAFELVEADIRDQDAMQRVFDQHAPTSIIHIAARAGVRPSIEQPGLYAQVNVDATTRLMELAVAHDIDRFVLASSSSVYGNNDKVPFAETDAVDHPISPYAATKRACELIGHTFSHVHDLPVACLRFFTVFGPRQRPDLAISKFLRLVSEGKPIPMFGDGSTSRDYTYIADIVAGILAAHDRITDHGFRIWNLGNSSPISLAGMIDTIGRVVDKQPIIDRKPMQPGDVERTYADVSRARAELGYAPRVSFEEGVRRQFESMQAPDRAALSANT